MFRSWACCTLIETHACFPVGIYWPGAQSGLAHLNWNPQMFSRWAFVGQVIMGQTCRTSTCTKLSAFHTEEGGQGRDPLECESFHSFWSTCAFSLLSWQERSWLRPLCNFNGHFVSICTHWSLVHDALLLIEGTGANCVCPMWWAAYQRFPFSFLFWLYWSKRGILQLGHRRFYSGACLWIEYLAFWKVNIFRKFQNKKWLLFGCLCLIHFYLLFIFLLVDEILVLACI